VQRALVINACPFCPRVADSKSSTVKYPEAIDRQ
jgi:hypothetical protein